MNGVQHAGSYNSYRCLFPFCAFASAVPSFDNDPHVGVKATLWKRLLCVKASVCKRDIGYDFPKLLDILTPALHLCRRHHLSLLRDPSQSGPFASGFHRGGVREGHEALGRSRSKLTLRDHFIVRKKIQLPTFSQGHTAKTC